MLTQSLALQREKIMEPSHRKKKQHVDLGKHGSFTINHPGVVRAAARRAGESTHEWAESHKSSPGKAGSRARSALGLMAMNHRKRK